MPAPAIAATTPGPGCILYGDSNQDGVFWVEDEWLLESWLNGVPPIPQPGTHAFLATDVDFDQRITWFDALLIIDKLNGIIEHFPYGDSTCLFSFAGFEWQVYDVSTYVVPNQYIPRTPEDIIHSESEIAINSHDQYVFRGVKTIADFPEGPVTFTIEMWQTEMFHWQSLPFGAVLPSASLAYFNWDRQWYFDTVTESGGGDRHIYDLTPGGAQLNVHYSAKFEYNPATHMLVFSFRKGDEAYQEVYRGVSYWGRTGMESHGENHRNGHKTAKIFLLSSDGHGTAHYRLSWEETPPSGDQTPPVVSASITGTLGSNGWYTSNVGLSWNVSDAESGITSTSGCEAVSLTANTTGASFSCTATNGEGLSTTVPATIKIDKDAPVVQPTVTGTLGLNGWYLSDVTVNWAVSDATSRIGSSTGCGVTTLTTNTAGTTVTCNATNNAGLTTAGQVTVKIDKSPAGITRNLIAVVASLPNVNAGIKNSLTSKLDNALASLTRGNGNAARNQLAAFINEVEAQAGKALRVADAVFLIQQARNAMAGIVS
ncbi:MAG: hypothetical protein JNN08_07675 [Bryobacterales bacterium]|nr:hypothetical protein [Bryobacterales bacterium]